MINREKIKQRSDELSEAGLELEKGPTLNTKYNIYHNFYRDPDQHLYLDFLDCGWPGWHTAAKETTKHCPGWLKIRPGMSLVFESGLLLAGVL